MRVHPPSLDGAQPCAPGSRESREQEHSGPASWRLRLHKQLLMGAGRWASRPAVRGSAGRSGQVESSAHPVRGHFSEARGRGEDDEDPHCPHCGRSLRRNGLLLNYRPLSLLKKLRLASGRRAAVVRRGSGFGAKNLDLAHDRIARFRGPPRHFLDPDTASRSSPRHHGARS